MVIASLPWPIPLVSQKIKSKPTAFAASIARSRFALISEPLPRLASERMYRLLLDREFILILSPSSAPPVRFLVGSTQSRQTFLSGLSRRIRNINSSSRLLFPAPPVPVNPITGTSLSLERTFSTIALKSSSLADSDRVSRSPTFAISSAVIGPSRLVSLSSEIKSTALAVPIKSWIIPIRPIFRPSSGE